MNKYNIKELNHYSQSLKSHYIKLFAIFMILLAGYILAVPEVDLTLFSTFENPTGPSSLRETYAKLGQKVIHYSLEEDVKWKGVGPGTGAKEHLIERHYIIRKSDNLGAIHQSSVEKFKEGGHIESHKHDSHIETITGLKGKCILEIYNNDLNDNSKVISESFVIMTGSYVVISPFQSHSIRNDQEDECVVISSFIDFNNKI